MVELVHGDLTEQDVDAIVNAANEQLQHGGGVAAAIARRGGRTIQEESNRWVADHGPISHDKPAITGAGDLPCDYVIHVVGPRWGEGEEAAKLRAAVAAALRVAEAEALGSLAFPPISTGIFGYPADQAAGVILGALEGYAEDRASSSLEQVRLTIIDEATLAPFRDAFISRWAAPDSAG